MEGSSADGRYELFSELASGGMATVYLGRLVGPHGFKRSVAIKRMHDHIARDPQARDMFIDEARIASRIAHANVVPTLDIVTAKEQILLVMEYVEGETVRRLVSAPIPPKVAAAIAFDALCGLHAAHETRDEAGALLGVIHRDVSPENIIVGSDGVARVLDFGIANATGRVSSTRDGEIKGKMAYMPPEQLWAQELDRTADVYSLAVTLWEMLTGKKLFEAPSEAGMVKLVTEKKLDKPSTIVEDAKPLDAVVMRALSRDVKRRYQTADEMARAIEAALPIAGRLEVADWVRKNASDTLAERSKLVGAMRRGEKSPGITPDMNVVESVLGTAIELHEPPKKRRRPLVLPLALGFVLVVTAFAVGRLGMQRNATVTTTPPPVPTPATSTVTPATSAPVATPASGAPATNDASATSSSAAPAPSGAAPPSSILKPKPKPTTPRPPASLCDPPWVIDEKGYRHYVEGCF